jgi:type IV pilus assembly protein PilY1
MTSQRKSHVNAGMVPEAKLKSRSRLTGAWVRAGLMASLAFSSALLAQTGPSQSPLLTGTAGARPNLMITLDNSGSMAFPFHESYGVLTDSQTAIELRRCRDTDWSDIGGNWVQGGMADVANGNRCIFLSGGAYYYSTTRSIAYVPAASTRGAWVAQRSAQVNPLYYDPRVTYALRVGPDGNPLVPGDGIVFVSNQNSTDFVYRVFRNDANSAEIRSTHTFYANNPAVGAGWTEIYGPVTRYRIPQHIAYTAANVGTATNFTYHTCTDVITVAGLQVGCNAWSAAVNIRPGTPANITLPANHRRTDCTGGTCTNAQEIANIMNWYRYYAFRAPAVATALGQALANTEYNGRMRIGYSLINQRNNTVISATAQTPGVTTNQPMQVRGVRMHNVGSAATAEIYRWLYDQDGTQNRISNLGASPTFNSTANRRQAPYGGTPLHNSVDRVASYYRVGTGAVENPWATNPAAMHGANNPEMTCRRSFNLLFSDGAWNGGTSTIDGQDFDNTDGPLFERTLADGSTDTFRYRRQGINTVTGRRMYTPYPSTATSGLADLTARYFWHEDLRTALANEVQTVSGQPTFWQNMATYTIGYMVRPSGEVPGATSGLTFDQITNYQAQYPAVGYAAATKPSWTTNLWSDQARVDDFIQAGYTGGGRGFSVTTADEVRRAFRQVLADVDNSQGRDAGVAVSSTGADTSSIAGNLKYVVTYRTIDNSGNVIAQELDAQGNVADIRWQASNTIPAHSARRVFSISGQSSPFNFLGNFSGLPTDVRTALQSGSNPSRIPTDERFVDYLRGRELVTDNDGILFRQREEKMGAMVNPPSIYMGGDRDFAYDLVDGSGAVSGSEIYEAYARTKADLPASLFVATNAGQVHAFGAESGAELAAFMPRRSMRRLLDNAREDYTFRYVLDGPLSQHDIFSAGANRWNHMAVGTGGRGERLIYALRSPLNTAATTPNRTPDVADFLWETGPENVNEPNFALGHMTHPARSGQTENGEWVVLLNSGHHNGFTDGSRHGLLVLNALTGDVIRRIALPGTYSAGRGLSGVTVVRNANKRIVAAYAGDANGNLWRFNLRGTPAAWGVSYSRPLFTTPGNRPIYGAPAWQANRRLGGTMVVFATGMLLDDTDPADVSMGESIYGIWDPTPVGEADVLPFSTVQPSELLSQNVLPGAGDVGVDGNRFFRTSENRFDPDVHKGWRMPLDRATGERNIDQVRNLGPNVLIATTVIAPPADPNAEMCRLSDLPTNYLYVLDAQSGSMARRALDRDGDGRLEAYGMVQVERGGYSRGMAVKPLSNESDRWSANTRRKNSAPGDEGESLPEGNCSPVNARLLGTEAGSIGAGGSCETGWNRSQYQLSRPPQ